MKKISLIALALLLTSCKYNGSWDVQAPLTLKTKSGEMIIPISNELADSGSVNITKSKITLVFEGDPDLKFEAKVPKGKYTQKDGDFEVLGSDIGQIYDFEGSTYSEYETVQTQCERMCKDENGFDVSCIPQEWYDCEQTYTNYFLNLKVVDPTTRKIKAVFHGMQN